MKPARAVFLVVGLAIIAVLAVLVWMQQTGREGPDNWDDVHFGHAREKVIELLGQPDDETDTFPLPQHETIADEAAKAGAKAWLIYRTRFGPTCVVGLGNGDRVVFKARG